MQGENNSDIKPQSVSEVKTEPVSNVTPEVKDAVTTANTSVQATPIKKKSGLGTFIIVFVLIIVALLGGLIGGYLLWGQDKFDLQSIFIDKKADEQKNDDADENEQKKDQKEDEENGEDSDKKDEGEEASEGKKNNDSEEESEDEDQQFSGDAISAVLPDGWQIVEYYDGAGTDMLVETLSYEGISAIEVINPDNEVIFKLKGVYGIGGTDYCAEYYKFADFDQADYDYFEGVNDEFFQVDLPIVDLSGVSYSEINLFERELRRVDKVLYIDRIDTNATFDAGCGISKAMWEIESLTLNQDTYVNHTYTWYINDSATDQELEILDDILNSFVAL